MEKLIITDGKGAVNSKGEVIIPSQYDCIETLQSGLYVADSEDTGYHFYTDEGKLKLNDYVKYYHTDDDGNLIAVKLNDNMWRLIEINFLHLQIDYIENAPKCISMISNQNEDYVVLRTSDGWKYVYSLKEKKVIFESNYNFEMTQKGFVVKNKEDKVAFINLENEIILDYKWDRIEACSECIKVMTSEWDMWEFNEQRCGIYSYTGECVLECKYESLQVYDIYVCGMKKTIFKVEEAGGWSFLDYDGSTIFHTKNEIPLVYQEKAVFIIEKENKDIMYKFDILNNEIKAVPIFIGDKIEFALEYGIDGAFFVKRKGKYGMYNQYGAELIPAKYKTIDEIVKMVK